MYEYHIKISAQYLVPFLRYESKREPHFFLLRRFLHFLALAEREKHGARATENWMTLHFPSFGHENGKFHKNARK